MPRGNDLSARMTHLKNHVTGLQFPNQIDEYEAFRVDMEIVQGRAAELRWWAEDFQTNPPEWYEVETLWDTYAALTGRDAEAGLFYDTQQRIYRCADVDLKETLVRSRDYLAGLVRDLQAAAARAQGG